MNYPDFENKARLYVVGALDEDELESFELARQRFGARAEEVIKENDGLAAAFALSLPPEPPHPKTKERLLSLIRATLHDS